MKLISDYLAKSETAPRSEIDKLLWDKLSDALDSEQKKVKINNLISKMRQEGMIENVGSRKAPKWQKLNK